MVACPDAIEAAYAAGINFFFLSADMHWPLYEHTRTGLRNLLRANPGARDDIAIAAASYVTQPEFLRLPFEELLDAEPGLSRLDLLVSGGEYLHTLSARSEVLHGHLDSSFLGCRSIGASFHDRKAAAHALRHSLVDIAFVRYNARHRAAEHDVFSIAATSSARVFVFKSTTGFVSESRLQELGITDLDWTPEVADHYRFTFFAPGVSGILCSPGSPQEVEALDRALQRGPLTPEERQLLANLCLVDRGIASYD